ncbi:glycosyltransferase family 2 protein [Sphingobacterium detergens]|uniref:Glycosyltransferase involved in cell wall biosynthesis n=1 Tax=Sphingobacterium detergens TaxID=1145106 RepID=A0A420AXK8_SPHD1|nr:glycosyltransferase [Sphingobacterium detergens]RKE49212.1 glycosyltransferase involved in cell wall biosynthesis [Sphingobacterium detergens]
MNTKIPTVTVLMAAYNSERYISQAIKSILNQTYANFELLIIDDGSTDGTIEQINTFDDNRIKLLQNENNQGVVYTRNRAIEEAIGEFIAIMDSDDIATPNRLEILLNKFNKQPQLALIGSHASIIDSNGHLTGQQIKVETDPQLLRYRLFFGNSFAHSSVMIRTSVFREFGGYRLPLAEDYDLFLRISTKYPVLNLDEALLLYREHPMGISKKFAVELDNQLILIKEHILFHLNLPSDKKYQKILTPPFIWNNIDIKDYKEFYTTLFNHIGAAEKPTLEVQKFIFEKWYEVIIKKAGKQTFVLFFTSPFFGWKYITAKQLRRALKNTVKNLFK